MTTQNEMHPQRWGNPAAATDLPEDARGLIELAFGITERPAVSGAVPPASATTPDVIAALVGVVGEEHVLLDDATRALRTRGKSTPDLLKARAGDLSDAPDVVVRPADQAEIERLLAVAVAHDLAVVPFGGGTSVTGGLVAARSSDGVASRPSDGVAARAPYAGVVSLDLIRMKALVAVDRESMTATLEPGLRGPEAEALLAALGLTLGHYPQSFEYATIGGFAATRSSGQSSAGYGRFDALVVALTVVTPSGTITVGSAPANAAGPDLRQVFLGSEGVLGVISSVTVRVRELPAVKEFVGWRWPSFDAGATAMRTLAQAGLLPTTLRLSDEAETAINLADPAAIGGTDNPGCVMITGFEGTRSAVDAKRNAVTAILTDLGGTDLGEAPGEKWALGRFNAPYLRDSMLDVGVLVETLETATFWSNRTRLYADVKAALETSLGEGSIVLCHISHVYETGCSLYFTIATKEKDDVLAQWAAAKSAASDAMIAAGATITHHHAVGTDHKPWFHQEIGPVGVQALRALKASLDPAGILNPGVLV